MHVRSAKSNLGKGQSHTNQPPPPLPALTGWGFPLTFDSRWKLFFPTASRWPAGGSPLLITLCSLFPDMDGLKMWGFGSIFATLHPTNLLLMRLVAGKGYTHNCCVCGGE